MLQILVIVVDRFAYLKRSVVTKLLLQAVTVAYVHYKVFFEASLVTGRAAQSINITNSAPLPLCLARRSVWKYLTAKMVSFTAIVCDVHPNAGKCWASMQAVIMCQGSSRCHVFKYASCATAATVAVRAAITGTAPTVHTKTTITGYYFRSCCNNCRRHVNVAI